ncbi:MAG: hypothetical protein FWF77_09580 [Defluviitaleaceae bacterium]|nr:hypothetical protein [Defluviitaleaceae bacterium]
MSAATHSLEAESSFLLAEKNESASVTRRLVFFARFHGNKKARQARGRHRGHMSAATHSLEAGSNSSAHKKIDDVSNTNIIDFSKLTIARFTI